MLHTYDPSFIYLKEEDAIKAGAIDMKMTLEACEEVHKLMGEGQIANPAKTHTTLPLGSNKENWQSFFNAMPCYIGGDVNVAGVKWAAEAVKNGPVPGIPRGIDVTILSDPDTVLPFCILNGSLITAMRTGATAGLFAKYTAPSNAVTVTSIGCGVVGRCTIMAVAEAMPQIKKIYVADLDMSKADDIVKEYQPQYPNVELVPTDNPKAAAAESQIIITQTTSNREFIDMSWVKPGTSLVAMGEIEIDPEVVLKSDIRVNDYWNQLITHDTRPIAVLHRQGKLNKEDTWDLTDVILDPMKGRQNDEQFVFSSALGLGSLDIMISYKMFLRAKELGIGQILKMYDKPLWE